MKNFLFNMLKNIRIKTRLMAVCLLLVIVPVIILGFASYNATKNGINEQSSVLLQQEVLLVKAQVESNYNMIEEKLKSDLKLANSIYGEQLSFANSRIKRASQDQNVINSFNDPDNLHIALKDLTRWGNLDFLTVTDTSGKVIARANNRNSGDTFLPDQVHTATNGGFVSTEIIANKYLSNEGLSDRVDPDSNGMAICAIYPVVVNGKIVGTIAGGYILNNNHQIVDEIKSMIGGTATIFQDDLRISTNVEKDDGTRAVGTTVSDTVYNSVINNGKTYYGKAWVVNDWYQTAYEPIKDSSGNAVGILYVGVRQSEFQNDMMNSLAGVVIGKTGYVYILDSEGNYVLSMNRQRDGDNIWGAKDASGRLFVQDIINKGSVLQGDETYVEHYPWQNEGESSPRMKLAAIAYSSEFDWVIGASCYDEDFAGPIAAVKNTTILIGILAIIFGILIAYLLSRSISGGITGIVDDFKDMTNNIVNGKIDSRSDPDNTGIDFREVPNGLNNIMDAMTAPINMMSDHIGRLSRGDIPDKITKEYKGDFNKVKNDLNNMIERVGAQISNLSSIPTPVMTVDKDFTITYMNTAGAKILGLTQLECEGKKCYDLFKTGHCNTPDCQVAKAMFQNNTFTSDTVANLASGELPIRYTGTPVRDIQGNIIGGLEYVVDISEEKQAVAEMEQIVESAVAGKLDVRGNPDNYKIIGFKNVIQGINDTLDAIIEPVDECGRILQKVASGNLTERTTVAASGQMKDLLSDVDACVDSITHLVSNSKSTAQKISVAARQLSSSSEEMNTGTEMISSTMQEIAQGAANQSEQVGSTSEIMGEMASGVGEITQKAQSASEVSINASKIAQDGGEAASTATFKMKDIQSAVETSAELVQRLGERSKEIGEIVTVITGIAEQTNMLALNAAIEAARAGEAGRGFAVVADEVRNLAEESRGAAEKISVLINETQSETEEAVKSMETGTFEVKEGSDIVNKALVALENISSGSQEVANMIEEISASTQQQQAGIENVVKSIDGIAAVAQENAAGTQEASGAAQQQTASMEEVTSQIQELANISDELMDSLSSFTLAEAQ